VRVVLGGVPVTLLDTAGLRDTDDPVEAEGVRRAKARAAAADYVIAVHDGDARLEWASAAPGRLVVRNKCDLHSAGQSEGVPVSALTGAGLPTLRETLAAEARRLIAQGGSPPLTRARHRAALTAAMTRLAQAETAPLAELRGEDLRVALYELGRITGNVGAESVLDAVFGQFCIGK
jgi:tRNA modification GTPase